MQSTGYLPHIDGIRAVAVIAVITYHLSAIDFPLNGYLGVDAFFVVSGFVIGRQIYRQVKEERFCLRSFYRRRFWRLAPLLLVVIAFSSFVAPYLLPQDRIGAFVASALAAISGTSNFYFYFSQSYWSPDSSTIPLLHTWSLGVEEQFYLLFPIIAPFILSLRRKSVSLMLGLVVLVMSLFLFFTTAQNFSAFSFYLLPARIWEFLAGVLCVPACERLKIKSGQIISFLAPVGLLLLAAALGLAAERLPHQYFLNLFAVLGTVALIIGGAESSRVSAVLTSRLLRFVGKVSYSLYLWHYPVLVFGRYFFGEPTVLQEAALILLISIVSIASYYLIEMPLRRIGYEELDKKRTQKAWAGAAVVIVSLALPIAQFVRLGVVSEEKPATPTSYLGLEPAFLNTERSHNQQIIFVGDSHSELQMKAFLKSGRSEQYRIGYALSSNCPFLLGAERVDLMSRRVHPECGKDIQVRRAEFLASLEPSVIVLGARLTPYMAPPGLGGGLPNFDDWDTGFSLGGGGLVDRNSSKQNIVEAFRNSIALLEQHGHHVVIVYPIPESPVHVGDYAATMKIRNGRDWFETHSISTSYSSYLAVNRELLNLYDEATSVSRVFPHLALCDVAEDVCRMNVGAETFYVDQHHLTPAGGELVNEQLLELLNEAR